MFTLFIVPQSNARVFTRTGGDAIEWVANNFGNFASMAVQLILFGLSRQPIAESLLLREHTHVIDARLSLLFQLLYLLLEGNILHLQFGQSLPLPLQDISFDDRGRFQIGRFNISLVLKLLGSRLKAILDEVLQNGRV